MVTIDTKLKEKKTHTETVKVAVFYAAAGNQYGLLEGWYEYDDDSPVPVEECGVLELSYLPSEPYRRYLRDQALKNKKKLRRGKLSQDQIDEIDIRAVAIFGIKGWDGFKDQNTGEEIGYDTEVGYNALYNDRALLDFVCDLCRDDELFDKQGEADADEALIKN